ncbi:MAG TPA: Ldh family oxidoreductase, partial [Solirubrobacteraceae bacterium]|nr:Ldh family oxidoreductase [Solirubrobacteraceae bacterium]
KMQPTSKFGEMFQYSNVMAAAAGFVAGHVLYPKLELGGAYDKAMQTYVLDPLGMKATTFDYARALRGNHAMPHSPDVDGKPAKALMEMNYSAIPVRPAGAAWSNVHDMLRYVQMELADGKLPDGKTYIAKEPLLARRAPQVAIGKDTTYGMGLMVNTHYGIPVVHHGGDLIGYHSDMMWLPEQGVGAVILQDSPHVGRMADYVELIAARGQLGMTVTNARPNVAPFGGRARRLGTDPIAFAIPRAGGRPPIVVDFATSVRAEGKVRVARAAGRTVPAGTLIDAEGRPSINPEDYYNGGALLPAEGHKGYALAVAIEGLGGILSGMGPAMLPAYGDGNGMFVMALEIEAFISVEHYMGQVEEMAQALESTPTAPGIERVLLPGQPELLSAERRRREGIPIAEATMSELRELAAELGATLPVHG